VTYHPARDGIARTAAAVRYTEAPPPPHLAELVHCAWELRTLAELSEDFTYHALPDACVNLLLDQADPRIAGVTQLRTTAAELTLGRSFHYVGIQLFPGVWQGSRSEITDAYVGTPYRGSLPLVRTNERLAGLTFEAQVPILVELAEWCAREGLIVPNPVTSRILAELDTLRSVAAMAECVGMSPRHLQRVLKRTTGLSPHDLLKVLRVQQSFRRHYLDLYADQSHFIHAFRQATGYTPGRYRAQFDV
jgi:AraC-like DNA-binding protein